MFCKTETVTLYCHIPYDLLADTKTFADVSAYGLSAVLLQETDGGEWQPVPHTSRSMTKTEMHEVYTNWEGSPWSNREIIRLTSTSKASFISATKSVFTRLRRIRTDVRETKWRLTPNWPYIQGYPKKDKDVKQKEMHDWHSTEYALSQPCQTTLHYGSTPKVTKCLEEHVEYVSQLQTPHAPMWWRFSLVVASEETTCTLLCHPVQGTAPNQRLTQQTTLLAAGQTNPK